MCIRRDHSEKAKKVVKTPKEIKLLNMTLKYSYFGNS